MRNLNHYLLGFVSLMVLTGAVGLLAPAPSWATLECGDHIFPGESAFLTHDLNCSGYDPALTIEGPATLLMQGHTLDCQDLSAFGIRVIGESAIVLKGTVTGCDQGVRLEGQGGHLIKKVTATQNDEGFQIMGGSDGNTLTYNKAKNNNAHGFVTLQSHDNEFSWNRIQGNFSGFALTGDHNTVKYNTAKNHERVGFLFFGEDNIVIGNRALNTHDVERGAFELFGSSSTMSQNVAKNNDGIGIVVSGSDHEVLGNIAKNNLEGIVLKDDATGSTVLGNTAKNNDIDLVDDNLNCGTNTWVDNRFRTSNQGCIQ